MIKLLLVDDDKVVLTTLKEGILTFIKNEQDITISTCASLEEVTLLLDCNKEEIDVIAVDMFLGTGTGLEVINEFKKRQPSVGKIIITGYLHKFTKEMLKEGIFILQKPVRVEDLVSLVRIISRYKDLQKATYG